MFIESLTQPELVDWLKSRKGFLVGIVSMAVCKKRKQKMADVSQREVFVGNEGMAL